MIVGWDLDGASIRMEQDTIKETAAACKVNCFQNSLLECILIKSYVFIDISANKFKLNGIDDFNLQNTPAVVITQEVLWMNHQNQSALDHLSFLTPLYQWLAFLLQEPCLVCVLVGQWGFWLVLS